MSEFPQLCDTVGKIKNCLFFFLHRRKVTMFTNWEQHTSIFDYKLSQSHLCFIWFKPLRHSICTASLHSRFDVWVEVKLKKKAKRYSKYWNVISQMQILLFLFQVLTWSNFLEGTEFVESEYSTISVCVFCLFWVPLEVMAIPNQ